MTPFRSCIVALAGGLFSASALAQGVFKCTDAKGQVLFQQGPCVGTAKAEVVTSLPANVVEGRPAGDAAWRAKMQRSSAVRVEIESGRVASGMTESEMRQALGEPITVNTDTVEGRVSRQFIYRYPDGSTRYVYTRDGVVYAHQDRPSAPRPSEPCYSQQDIWNAGVGMNSQSRTQSERDAIRKRVDQMKRC